MRFEVAYHHQASVVLKNGRKPRTFAYRAKTFLDIRDVDADSAPAVALILGGEYRVVDGDLYEHLSPPFHQRIAGQRRNGVSQSDFAQMASLYDDMDHPGNTLPLERRPARPLADRRCALGDDADVKTVVADEGPSCEAALHGWAAHVVLIGGFLFKRTDEPVLAYTEGYGSLSTLPVGNIPAVDGRNFHFNVGRPELAVEWVGSVLGGAPVAVADVDIYDPTPFLFEDSFRLLAGVGVRFCVAVAPFVKDMPNGFFLFRNGRRSPMGLLQEFEAAVRNGGEAPAASLAAQFEQLLAAARPYLASKPDVLPHYEAAGRAIALWRETACNDEADDLSAAFSLR